MSSCLGMVVKPWLVVQVHLALWAILFCLSCRFHSAMYHSWASHCRLTTSFWHIFAFCHHVPALSGLNCRIVSGTWFYICAHAVAPRYRRTYEWLFSNLSRKDYWLANKLHFLQLWVKAIQLANMAVAFIDTEIYQMYTYWFTDNFQT